MFREKRALVSPEACVCFTCSVPQESSAEHPGSLNDRSRSPCLARRCLGYPLCYFVCYHSAERRSDRCISDPHFDLDICLVDNDLCDRLRHFRWNKGDNAYGCRGLPDSYRYFLGIPVSNLSVSLDYSFGYPDPSLGRGRAGLRNFSDLAYFSRMDHPACERSWFARYTMQQGTSTGGPYRLDKWYTLLAVVAMVIVFLLVFLDSLSWFPRSQGPFARHSNRHIGVPPFDRRCKVPSARLCTGTYLRGDCPCHRHHSEL